MPADPRCYHWVWTSREFSCKQNFFPGCIFYHDNLQTQPRLFPPPEEVLPAFDIPTDFHPEALDFPERGWRKSVVLVA